jgi:hypothetical protein
MKALFMVFLAVVWAASAAQAGVELARADCGSIVGGCNRPACQTYYCDKNPCSKNDDCSMRCFVGNLTIPWQGCPPGVTGTYKSCYANHWDVDCGTVEVDNGWCDNGCWGGDKQDGVPCMRTSVCTNTTP